MHLGRLWSTEQNKHISIEGPGERAYSAYPVDWDLDGDLDLLIGGSEGGMFLRLNEGTKKKPLFAVKPVPVEMSPGKAATVPKYAMPLFVDWDGDGLRDLISGSYGGAVFWFKNTGTAKAPSFAGRKQLIPNVKKGEDVRGPRSQVEVVDYDGDGDMDLLVGDLHMNYNQEEKRFDNHAYVWLFRREAPSPDAVAPKPRAGEDQQAGGR